MWEVGGDRKVVGVKDVERGKEGIGRSKMV